MKSILEQLNLLERIDQLIRLKATGTPKQLADKLELSEREVYRIIAELKERDIKIAYCKQRCTYYYMEETILKFQMCVIENGKERKLIGGENLTLLYENYFPTDKIWQSGLSSL
jgi:hypothetical protein